METEGAGGQGLSPEQCTVADRMVAEPHTSQINTAFRVASDGVYLSSFVS